MSDRHLGKKVRCAGCGRTILVNAEDQAAIERHQDSGPAANRPGAASGAAGALITLNAIVGFLILSAGILAAIQFSRDPPLMLGFLCGSGTAAIIHWSLAAALSLLRDAAQRTESPE